MRYSLLLASLISILVSGCATTKPKFQKGIPGYRIADAISDTGFVVTMELGPHVDEKYSEVYGIRAIGEECLARGFNYFDFAIREPQSVEGFCYKTADHPGLGIEFAAKGLSVRPEQFVIADLNGKTKTLLQKGDEILEIDGKPPKNVATFKSKVFRASMTNQKTVDLKVKRGDQVLQIKEPIALFKNSSMGSTQLDLLRAATN
jgi:hypothetical protein